MLPEYAAVTRRPVAGSAGLEDWMGFPILVAWIVGPLLVRYLRFSSADV